MNASLITLREVLPSDLPIFAEQQLEPEATRMAGFPSREPEAFMTHWTRIMSDRTNILRTILEDGLVAGNVVSWDESGKRKVGYWLGKEFWGRGIATNAVAQFIAEVKSRPLYAHVVRHNIASRRVLEKNGFVLSGADRVLPPPPADPVEELIFRLD